MLCMFCVSSAKKTMDFRLFKWSVFSFDSKMKNVCLNHRKKSVQKWVRQESRDRDESDDGDRTPSKDYTTIKRSDMCENTTSPIIIYNIDTVRWLDCTLDCFNWRSSLSDTITAGQESGSRRRRRGSNHNRVYMYLYVSIYNDC